jgi:head-tail adaptor
VEAGSLRHRVEIYGKAKIINELNQTSYEDALVTTVWAEIIPQTGNMQRQQVETMLTNVTHKLSCRYNRAIMEAYQQQKNKADMHIMIENHRFNVRYILNSYFRKVSLEIFVEEVIG